MLVVRPESSAASVGLSLLPLFSGACGGLYIILTRKLGKMESSFQLVTQDGAVASGACILLFLLSLTSSARGAVSVPPDLLRVFGPPVIAAVIGMISSLAMIKAAQLAPSAPDVRSKTCTGTTRTLNRLTSDGANEERPRNQVQLVQQIQRVLEVPRVAIPCSP